MLFAPGAFMTTMPRARGGGDVDVVDAGAGAGDHPQLRRGGDELRVDLGRAANDERVGVGEVAASSSGLRPGGRRPSSRRGSSETAEAERGEEISWQMTNVQSTTHDGSSRSA